MKSPYFPQLHRNLEEGLDHSVKLYYVSEIGAAF